MLQVDGCLCALDQSSVGKAFRAESEFEIVTHNVSPLGLNGSEVDRQILSEDGLGDVVWLSLPILAASILVEHCNDDVFRTLLEPGPFALCNTVCIFTLEREGDLVSGTLDILNDFIKLLERKIFDVVRCCDCGDLCEWS